MQESTSPPMQALWQDGVRAVVFFDGTCGLCDHAVRFLMARDLRRKLRYSPLQGELYRRLFGEDKHDCMVVITLKRHGLDAVFRRSDAAIEAVRPLGFPWRFSVLFKLIPRFIRDTVYRFVAFIRYWVFGKYIACRVPEAGDRALFLP